MRMILVTGGAGHIGASLAAELVLDPGTYVVILDNLSTGSAANLPPRQYPNWRFLEADVNSRGDLADVMHSLRFDYVFHYAAMVGVKRTLANPIGVLADIDGIRNVLELSRATGVRRVLYSSSSEVYGEPVAIPQHESTTPLNSRLPYAVVKNVGEAYCRSFHRQYGLEYTIFRFFNTYGPRQSEDFVIPRFLKAALAGRDIEINGDGLQTRTFCHVDDNVEATLAALESPAARNETINVGADSETTILELARLAKRLTGSASRIVHKPPLPEGDMTRRVPDISRMCQLTGARPMSLEQGLRRLIAAQAGHAARDASGISTR